jgi:hypothetical protein
MATLRCARHFGHALLLLLAGCSNGRGSLDGPESSPPPASGAQDTFAVGGSVSGLSGSGLVLQNNSGDDVTVAANGSFTFATRLANAATYNVTVKSQPGGQSCIVRNAAGTVAAANVGNVDVSCAADQFTVGGSVTGLTGSSLVLQLNRGNDLTLVSDGGFAFETALTNGAAYEVSIKTQPTDPAQACAVSNASGTVTGANVSNIAVSCTGSDFSIGGTVSGLAGSGLLLQLNDGSDLDITSNGNFTFEDRLASGLQYRVKVQRQPSNPTQSCTVANAQGSVGGSNVTSVRVSCSSNTFPIGGTLSGLQGSGLVLQNNGGDDLAIDADGAFTFDSPLASGARYNVTVRTQPSDPIQACTVTNGRGTVGSAAVTGVAVRCSTSDFTIGGTVRNLSGSGLVLRNNDSDELTIGASGSFTFDTALPAGATYNVTIAEQPTNPAQICTVSNRFGIVGFGNVTNITVNCTTEGSTIGGRVRMLRGSGLVLQNNGGDDLAIASSGRFEFSTPLPRGTPYNVSVARQPANPTQTCNVRDGSGTVGGSDVRNVEVRCEGDDD